MECAVSYPRQMWDNPRMDGLKGIRDRFLGYTAFDTMSDASACGIRRPTTEGQEKLLEHLAGELEALGLDVYYGEEKVVMGTLKGNAPGVPVAFMAHVDTADDVPGNGVKARVWEDYDGSDIVLDGAVIRRSENPDLARYIGGTIITSDGTTLLGSDDKAGVAIIMEALSYIVSHPDILHGDIEVFFTPDEETGSGMDSFPYDRIRSRICYTVDGGAEGGVETECFNAASAVLTIHGSPTHFGDARGKLRNAVTAASALVSALPGSESPEATDGRYGYYCAESISGTAAEAKVGILIRDFTSEGFEHRIETVKALSHSIGLLYGVRIDSDISVSYRNMAEANKLEPKAMEAVDAAARRLSIDLKKEIIRGGTDGARLAEKGVSCPNLFTGGHNLHSLTEWVAVEAMEHGAELLVAIVEEMAG